MILIKFRHLTVHSCNFVIVTGTYKLMLCLLFRNCMLTQKTSMQLGSMKFLQIIIFSGLNCDFLVRDGIHLLNEKLDTVDT